MYVIVETHDEESDLRERHYVPIDKFVKMIKRRWLEMEDTPVSNTGSPNGSEGSNPSRRTS